MSDPRGWKKALELIEQEKEAKTGSLNLSGLGLTELPDQLQELTHLHSLNLMGNQLTVLPEWLGNLSQLNSLNLIHNQLTALPDTLGNLTQLSELHLSSNRLTSLPNSLGNLTNLPSLNLWDNQLTTLPNSLGNLTQLSELDLSFNQLTALPDTLGNLTQLSKLDLSSNQLTSLSGSLGNLTNLSSLGLSFNKLSFLPDSLGNLTNLPKLSLYSNQLTTLPDSLGNLTQLTYLNLSSNQLTSLPDWLGNLTQLSELDLSSNQLTTLPDSLGNLTQLTYLNLNFNQLTFLPDSLGNLTQLTYLNLSSNQLITLPNSLGNLINLSELKLYNNQLTSLPNSLGNLTNLSELILDDNQLTFLPDSLGNLTQLSILSFFNNQLNRLPKCLQLLPLKDLVLLNNPLPLTPELLYNHSHPKTILEIYFGACKPLYEAKLLLIGEAEVGKTSVIRRLVYEDFAQPGKTDGIDVHRWALPIEDHTVQVNIWDFGGQVIYRSTHQFFFTKRSVYLVVLAGRQDDPKVLEKWLKTVQQLAGEEAPVLVAVNKIDEHQPQLDERGLTLKYPQIAGFVYLSCKENYMIVKGQKQAGVSPLKTLLQQTITNLPHVNDLLHEAWWNVKKKLQSSSYEVMNYDEFVKICEEQLVKTDVAQKILVQLLHDLGVVVHFQDDPYLEHMGVLDPEWVTKGVYAILNSHKIEAQKGQLSLEDLKGVLDPAKYPTWRHSYLIELMKKFQLCFNLPSRDNRYLIPALLPPEQPPFEWPLAQSLALEYQYEDFLPDTVMLWLMVQTFERLDLARTWRTGFVLQAREGSEVVNEALVKGDEANRKLFIWVKGRENTQRGLLAVIRDRLVDIHARFQKLPFQEMCPAVNVEGKVVGLVNYQELLWLESEKFEQYVEPSLKAKIDVRASLNLVDEPEYRLMGELREVLVGRYNLDELKTFMMDLGVKLEVVIPLHQSYRGIVRDLVDYAKRNGLLGRLRMAAYEGRGFSRGR